MNLIFYRKPKIQWKRENKVFRSNEFIESNELNAVSQTTSTMCLSQENAAPFFASIQSSVCDSSEQHISIVLKQTAGTNAKYAFKKIVNLCEVLVAVACIGNAGCVTP